MAVITDGTGSTQVGVDQERAKVALFASDTEEALVANKDSGTGKLYLPVAGKNDNTIRALNVDRRGSMQLAPIILGLNETIESTVIDTQSKWTTTATTMAATQAAATGILINSGAITTTNTNYALVSQRRFERKLRNPLFARFRARLLGATNTTIEVGFGDSTGATACANGAYWQVTSAGVVQPVYTYNSVDITGTNIASLLTAGNYYQWGIIVDDDSVTFACQNTATEEMISEQTIQLPVTQTKQWAATHVPFVARCFIGTAAGTAPAVQLTEVCVGYMDGSGVLNKPWSHVAGEFKPAIWSPVAPTTSTVSWTNSAEPTSATLSNTAAGYTTLGGKFQFAAVAGATTDFCLFGYTVPAPYTFYCTGISISTWNVGAAVATTPHLLQWFAVPNQSAVSLATGTGRLALGSQSIAVGAAVGANFDREIVRTFQTPLVTQGGRFFDIGVRIPVGTATASQVIAGIVGVEGYFE